jgi:hypothetical protein
VVAWNRTRPGFVTPPGGRVAAFELLGRAVGIDVVSEREHGALDLVEELRGPLVAVVVARRDVSGAD